MEIEADTGSEAYLRLGQALLDAPRVSPRGLPTHELRDVTLVIHDPGQVHVLRTHRRPTLTIAATEGYQLLAGLSSLAQLNDASGGRFSRFTDDDALRGAYGPRVYGPLRRVARLLVEEPDTRQAVIPLWRPDELTRPSRDVPCTTSFQLFRRDDTLHLRVTMRSNDAWLGLPYDLMMFSLLQRTVAVGLDLKPGTYTHSVGSMHVYLPHDREALREVIERGPRAASFGSPLVSAGIPVPPEAARRYVDPLDNLDARLRAAELICTANEETPWRAAGEDDELSWVLAHVPALPMDHRLCHACRYVTGPEHACDKVGDGMRDVLDDLAAEHHRARAKHGLYSLDGEEIDDVRRLAALMEEVGEAAHEMTYDHSGDLGAAARLRRELIQVANVATTWASVLPPQSGEDHA